VIKPTSATLTIPFRQRRAVLVSGGVDSYLNYPRYLNDLKAFYRMLKINGFDAKDIQVVYAKGGVEDFFGDRVEPLEATVSKLSYAITTAFEGESPLTKDDLFVLMTTNHGEPHAMRLWGAEEQLTPAALGRMLGQFSEPVSVLGIFGQCYSKSFAGAFINKAIKTVFVTASEGQSHALPDGSYDSFLYHFINGLAGETVTGYPVDVVPGRIDSAFDFAIRYNTDGDQPAIMTINLPEDHIFTLHGRDPLI
jgi:hypothetical protein